MSESESVTPVAPVAPVAPVVSVGAPAAPAAAPATTLADLLAQKEALVRQQQEIAKSIAELQSAQRSGVVNQIKALMAQHGITADDLTTQKPPRTASAATKPPKDGVNKVAAKYRDPATGATWTGRGLKPRWLVTAIEQGRTQDEFLIENQAA